VVTALNPAVRTAYTSQWNLSVQHSLTVNDSIEISYLGSSAHHLPNPIDLSQCRPRADLFCDPATKPWPRYGLVLYADSAGNSSYEALIGKYDRRVDHGLNLQVEGPATFAVRQRFVSSAVWELPVGPGKRYGSDLPAWVALALGDWTVSGITVFASGQPVTLSAPNQTGSVLINHLPNRVCDGRNDRFSDNLRNNGFLWFDSACFPVPPIGYFGDSGPTVLPGPGINNWDVAVQKSFGIWREANRLQFRAEMYNTWNHTQFQQPNGDSGAGANFGRISATRPPRLIQLSIKLLW